MYFIIGILSLIAVLGGGGAYVASRRYQTFERLLARLLTRGLKGLEDVAEGRLRDCTVEHVQGGRELTEKSTIGQAIIFTSLKRNMSTARTDQVDALILRFNTHIHEFTQRNVFLL